jgi:excisionase family DNA binding protein
MDRLSADAIRCNHKSSVYDSVDDLAVELGVNRRAVYEGLKANRIPHIRLGRRYILPRAAISAWLKSADGKVPKAR